MNARTLAISFAFLLILFPAMAGAQTSADAHFGPQARTVTHHGWKISFSSTWFSATKNGQTITMDDFLYRDSMDCQEWSESGRMMSIVGTVVSFEWSMYAYCGGAHGWAETKYISIDLSKGGKEVSPADLFGPNAVEQALERDSVWKQAQKEGGVYQCVFLDKKNTVRGRFALHHLDHGRVAVRIGVGDYMAEACRGSLVQLGLYLPIPEKLAKDLEQAKREGTLMQDLFDPGESC